MDEAGKPEACKPKALTDYNIFIPRSPSGLMRDFILKCILLRNINSLYLNLNLIEADEEIKRKCVVVVSNLLMDNLTMAICSNLVNCFYEKIINHCQFGYAVMPDVALSFTQSVDIETQLNFTDSVRINSIITCIALILFYVLLTSAVCLNIQSAHMQTTNASITNLNHLSIKNFYKYSELKPFDKNNESIIEILFGNVIMLKVNYSLQNDSSLNPSFSHCKDAFEKLIGQLAVAEIYSSSCSIYENLLDTTQPIMLESQCCIRNSSKSFHMFNSCIQDTQIVESEQEIGSYMPTSCCWNHLALPFATGLHKADNQSLVDVTYNVLRPVGKDNDKPVTIPSNQQLFVNPMGHEASASQGSSNDGSPSVTVDDHEDKQLGIFQSNASTKEGNQLLEAQPEASHVPPSNSSNHFIEKNIVEKDGHSVLHNKFNEKNCSNLEYNVVKSDGKLSLASGIDQTTSLSSVPTAHTNPTTIANINTKLTGSVEHNFVGAHLVKSLPTEMESLPTVGPQLSALYNKKFDYNLQSSREEIREKGNARTTFYQHEVEQHAYNPGSAANPPVNHKVQVMVPKVKVETSKTTNEFMPKPLPKKSYIMSGNKQYPLVNNLISLPHMDHYFVKERTEIRPNYYLAKLVLHHQYQNR